MRKWLEVLEWVSVAERVRVHCGPSRAMLAALFVTVSLTGTDAVGSAPIRIMPLGDSITVGYTDNPTWSEPFESGYRSGLYSRLNNAGYNFQFVGQSPEPYNNAFGDPTLGGTVSPTLDLVGLGQDGHRGYGAETINGTNANIAGYLTADDPDIILMMIGINGMGSISPPQLETLVDTIFTTKPGVQLIVAQITPRSSFTQILFDYNTYVRDTLVPTHAGLGRNITTVDQYTNFLSNPLIPTSVDASLFSHTLHPNNAGYELMAQTWFEGIVSLPSMPSVSVNQQTGEIKIVNPAAGSAIDIQDYSITSASGTLDPSAWTPIAGNYDATPITGNGSVDNDDIWTVLTNTTEDLSEGEFGGNGGSIAIDTEVSLGVGAWVSNFIKDLQFTYTDTNGVLSSIPVVYEGVDIVFADLNFDGTVDELDWPIFQSANLSDLSGLSAAEAYQMGDLNVDGFNDVSDFHLFRTAYNDANGAGAFEAMVVASVPEPSSILLFAAGVAGLGVWRRKRTH